MPSLRVLGSSCAAVAVAAFALPGAVRAQGGLPDSLARRVDAVFAAYTSPGSPGCAVGVRRDGAVVLERGYGLAELEHGAPFTATTVSEAGSVTKQIVALTTRLLEQDGKLSLDDDVRRWVPELPDLGAKITLRQLIQHTSGLRDQWALIDLVHPRAASVVQTVPDVLALVVRQRALNFAPGSEWLYNNTGYLLLAVTIERASGQPLARFAADRIFAPLGMTRTQFRDDHTRIVPGRAAAYTGSAARGYRLLMPEYDVVGSGGVLTTVGDLLRLEANYESGTVGGKALVAAMTDSARLTDERRVPYAYGLVNGTHRGAVTVAHGGSTAGYRAHLLRVPARRSAVTVLCNVATVDAESLALRTAEAAFPDAFSEPSTERSSVARLASAAGTLGPQRSAALAGLWRDSITGERLALAATTDGRLVLGAPGARGDTLMPLGGGRFRLRAGVAAIGDERTPALRMQMDNGNRMTLTPVAPWRPDAAAMAALQGTYTSAELGASSALVLRGDTLLLRRPRFADATLRPLDADAFLAGAIRIEVERRPDGRPAALLLTNGRARRVRFDRDADTVAR